MMEKNRLYDGMLHDLDDVHLSERARKQAERQMRRAAAIVEVLIGRSHGGAGTRGVKDVSAAA
jgi:hypothetical protein